MAVIIGSARIDERGKASGGKAGDQTGNEVSTQDWYLHSKGWRVFRVLNDGSAEKIARCMEMACNSPHVGYDQGQRSTLYNAVKNAGFDIGQLKTDVETDCSALVRVCCAYAGIKLEDFRTSTQASILLKSGAFMELTDKKYTTKSVYLKRGDILVTKTKGHTVVVLSDGPLVEDQGNTAPSKPVALGDRLLKNGMEGPDVKELQSRLIELGYSCGSYGADGEFGDATELAVRKYQRDHYLDVDGKVGPKTYASIIDSLGADTDKGQYVTIIGGNCYVRTAPNTDGTALGVAHEGDMLSYGGSKSDTGWCLVEYKGRNAWVSGKYARLLNN